MVLQDEKCRTLISTKCPLNSNIFELVETHDFHSKRVCGCHASDKLTRKFADSCEHDALTCPHCSLPTDEPYDSINVPFDSDVQVFSEPAFFSDDFIGSYLGDYKIQERIGSGGMARVYLAQDRQLKRHVAVKIIQNRNYVSIDSQAQLLKAEAVSQASLHHPNVVGIYHVSSHDGLPYLAMEYVDGGSLAEKIKEEKLRFDQILAFTRQIISGLAEAYRIGLIHGDIKPANLLIDDDGQVKLSDFGLARQVSDENSVPKMLVGTPAFMAPELFEMEPIDEQSDLFSLGVTLFQLSFGNVPYVLEGQTVEELKICFASAEIDFPDEMPSDIPEWWKEILSRLLQKDRGQRYKNILQLEQDLEEKSSRAVEAKPVPKLSSFLLENILFGFLCLPLLGLVTGVAGTLGASNSPLFVLSAIAGPLCYIALTSSGGRTAGQVISNTRFNQQRSQRPQPGTLAKYQILQLLPVICLLCGAIITSVLGTQAALTLMSCGLAIAICHSLDVFIHKNRSTFIERACHLKTVVDV